MDADQLLARAAADLHARGERMTVPRRAVLQALAESPGHRTVEEIAAAVAERDPAVARASVYRSIDAFVALGIVAHVHVGHGTTVYHLAADDRVYAQCRRCGTLVALPTGVLASAGEAFAEAHGFTLDPTHVALSGVCARCAAS
ncbi:Fur family transcriptional regulator [Nigerium massiliense]|uniref:Fur family transcriptional regulator n=1 Tax=Nigerium massiliense TaxID=1522317 RepID=UPI0005905BB4|nr:Fur family transcriptional regulator [Nigerium massiliense]